MGLAMTIQDLLPCSNKVLIFQTIISRKFSKFNIKLACSMCNNAKSDKYFVEEFEDIGKAIGKICKDRLQQMRSIK